MKALICGAGIAGLTAAWHLERSGWEVELVERAPSFRDGGYMIDFYGPGLRVAERMGLRPRLLEARHPVAALEYVDRHGRTTSGYDFAEFDFVISLLRGDLARAVAAEVRAPIRYGTTIEKIRRNAGRVHAELTDGTELEADLLIGADGTHSRVRRLAFGDGRRHLRYLHHHVAAYIITDDDLNRRVGARYRMLTAPGRTAAAYALRDGRLALMFLHHEPDPEPPPDPRAALRRRYADFGWIVPDALRACPPPSEVYYDQVTQVEMERWSHGRVVLLGDACQAVSLFAGHGASMAMAAAWILDDEVRRDPGDLPAALARYHDRMRPAIAETQALGRRVIRWMAPGSRRQIILRDWLTRLAALPGARSLIARRLTPGGHDLVPDVNGKTGLPDERGHRPPARRPRA